MNFFIYVKNKDVNEYLLPMVLFKTEKVAVLAAMFCGIFVPDELNKLSN